MKNNSSSFISFISLGTPKANHDIYDRMLHIEITVEIFSICMLWNSEQIVLQRGIITYYMNNGNCVWTNVQCLGYAGYSFVTTEFLAYSVYMVEICETPHPIQ